MKTRENTLRLMRFEAEEKGRRVQDLELMVRDLEQIALDLERQIVSEEERSGIKDPVHYAYSTFAKAAAERRQNILASLGDLNARLEQAIQERDEAVTDLRASEAADMRESNRDRRKFDTVTDSAAASALSEH